MNTIELSEEELILIHYNNRLDQKDFKRCINSLLLDRYNKGKEDMQNVIKRLSLQ